MIRTRIGLLIALVSLATLAGLATPGSPAALAQTPAPGQMFTPQSVAHAVSPPLASVTPLPVLPGQQALPRRVTPASQAQSSAQAQRDPVAQTTSGPLIQTTPGLSFPGVGQGDYGFSPGGFAPPDTEAAVGDTQVVQWVNTSFAVFNKSTGALLYGPAAGNTLFQALPADNGCRANNDGDPIAKFDRIAHRWVLTQFAVKTAPPFLQCVAVSQTNDATGAWNVYVFSYGNFFNDYGKVGVWPDAYYITYDFFASQGGPRTAPLACALDRNAMITNSPTANQQCFQVSSVNFGDLLPSDLDGSNPPPVGSPNFLLNFDFGGSSLNLWQFHVDWVRPVNSSFIGPVSIPVAAFAQACPGVVTDECIPQPGTGQGLDSVRDRLMYRLAYRNFAGNEELVVDHSVSALPAQSGIRWYELRKSANTNWSVFQQGTFAPDGNSRWMGSITMDKAGDIAVGYSVSSSTVFPSISYTGRVPSDPLGTMEAETSLKAGGGSQTGGSNSGRWGDYSAMTIDPADDCTFWYTNEYLKQTDPNEWSTWIASFRFPNCAGSTSPVVTELESSANPSMPDQPVTFTAAVICRGFTPTGTVTFADAGNPLASVPLSGGQASFTTSSLATGSHPMTAAYSGDGNCAASSSPVLTQTVGGRGPSPEPRSVNPSSSNNSSGPGGTVPGGACRVSGPPGSAC